MNQCQISADVCAARRTGDAVRQSVEERILPLCAVREIERVDFFVKILGCGLREGLGDAAHELDEELPERRAAEGAGKVEGLSGSPCRNEERILVMLLLCIRRKNTNKK